MYSTVAELTETAAAAVGTPGAVPGSDTEARARLGDYFAETLLLDQGTSAAKARSELDGIPPTPPSSTSSSTAITANNGGDWSAARGKGGGDGSPSGYPRLAVTELRQLREGDRVQGATCHRLRTDVNSS